jgi:DNA-binding response OmpR family regulator
MVEKNLLLIDDDALMRRSLAYNLERAGYHVQTEANAEDGIALAGRERPDLVVLDIGLPGMDGLEAVRIFRSKLNLPVIFLTARRRELDEVLGLELGADDYITKPFDLDVLVAHIKAVLRRAHPESVQENGQDIHAGDLVISPKEHTVCLAGQTIEVSPREFEMLRVLAERPDQVVTTADLLNQVWGAEYEGQPQVVYVHARWLREKIEKDPNHPRRLITVHGVGYKLISQEAQDANAA